MSSATDARYSRIASRMFEIASSSVDPCDQHPGRPGTDTLNPSSDAPRLIVYFKVATSSEESQAYRVPPKTSSVADLEASPGLVVRNARTGVELIQPCLDASHEQKPLNGVVDSCVLREILQGVKELLSVAARVHARTMAEISGMHQPD